MVTTAPAAAGQKHFRLGLMFAIGSAFTFGMSGPIAKTLMEAGWSPNAAVTARLAGGAASAMSLRQLTAWCDAKFGPHPVTSDSTPRPFDLPWVVLDSSKATRLWSWRPQTPTTTILEEIAAHAVAHPEWLDLSAPL